LERKLIVSQCVDMFSSLRILSYIFITVYESVCNLAPEICDRCCRFPTFL